MPYVAGGRDFAGQCLEPILALHSKKRWPSISSICRGDCLYPTGPGVVLWVQQHVPIPN